MFLKKSISVLEGEVKGNSSDLMHLPVEGFSSVTVYEEHNCNATRLVAECIIAMFETKGKQ